MIASKASSFLALAGVVLMSACGDAAPASDAVETPPEQAMTQDVAATEPGMDAALAGGDCETAVNQYVDALSSRDYAGAAKSWFDGSVDADRLAAAYGSFSAFLQPAPPVEEGAAGSLYCTVDIRLDNPANPDAVPITDSLQLRRVNDVPGATAEQLRWTVRSSSFIEKMDSSTQGQP